jgi:hypothetical protein
VRRGRVQRRRDAGADGSRERVRGRAGPYLGAVQARFDPQVEAAFACAYHLDARDPALSLRRFRVLLENLPPSAVRPGQEWSTEAELLAVLIDHVAELTYVTVKAAGGKGTRPKPIPRPQPAGARQTAGNGHAAGQPVREHRGGREPAGARKTGSWMEAAEWLMGLRGVEVQSE